MTPGGAEMSVSRDTIFLKSVNVILDLLAIRGIGTPQRCVRLTERVQAFTHLSIRPAKIRKNQKPHLWLTYHRANAMDHS